MRQNWHAAPDGSSQIPLAFVNIRLSSFQRVVCWRIGLNTARPYSH